MDVFAEGIETEDDVRAFLQLANECGFTGLGFYPDAVWPGKGFKGNFHLDTREGVPFDDPATWGRIGDDEYVGLEEAISHYVEDVL